MQLRLLVSMPLCIRHSLCHLQPFHKAFVHVLYSVITYGIIHSDTGSEEKAPVLTQPKVSTAFTGSSCVYYALYIAYTHPYTHYIHTKV